MKFIYFFVSVVYLPLVLPASTIMIHKRDARSAATDQSIMWAKSGLSTISNSARALQLSLLNMKEGKNFEEWMAYYDDLNSKYIQTSDFMGLALNSELSNFVKAAVAGFAIGILTPILGIIWLLFRRCNLCGGNKPSEAGYSSKEIYGLAGFFTLMAIFNIIFAGVFIGFSAQFTQSITGVRKGLNLALSSVEDTLTNTADGLSASPAIIEDTLNDIVNSVISRDFGKDFNQSFDVPIRSLESKFGQIDSLKRTLIVSLNSTDKKVKDLITIAGLVPGQLRKLGSDVAALRTIEIQGQSYNISGFPDTSSLINFNPIDLSGLPDIQDYVQEVRDVPDLMDFAVQIKDKMNSVTGTLKDFINSTVKTQVPQLNAQSGGFSEYSNMLNNTNVQLKQMAEPFLEQIDFYYNMGLTYDNYRHLAFIGLMLLIIVPATAAMLGVGIKKRVLMTPFCSCILFLAFFIWLFFLVFYIMSAPLNVICGSKDALLSSEIPLPFSGFSASANSTTAATNISVVPKAILDSCTNKSTNILTISVNNDGTNLKTMVLDFIDDMLKTTINKDQVQDQIQLPDFEDSVSNIDIDALSSFNTSGLEVPNFKLSANVTVEVEKIEAQVAKFNATSVQPDFGNYDTRDQKIQAFNAQMQTATGNNPNYNSVNFTDIFVVQNQTFTASDYTGDSVQQGQLNLKFLEAKSRASFIYYADAALAIQRARIHNITVQLLDIERSQIALMTSTKDLLSQTKDGINATISGMISIVKAVKLDTVPQFATAIDEFIETMIAFILETALSGVRLLIKNVFEDNTIEDFGKCYQIADSLNYMTDSFCLGITDTLSGFWYTLMLIGIFFVLAFVPLVLTKKRIHFLEKRTNAVKDKKSDAETGDFTSPTGVVATAPLDDTMPAGEESEEESRNADEDEQELFSVEETNRRSD